jgi:hypothetical protein
MQFLLTGIRELCCGRESGAPTSSGVLRDVLHSSCTAEGSDVRKDRSSFLLTICEWRVTAIKPAGPIFWVCN